MDAWTHAFDLQVGQADVKGLIGIRIPDQTYVGHHKTAQVALIAGQVPDALHLAVHLLIRQQNQLTRLHYSASQLQIPIEKRALIQTKDREREN